MKILIANPGSSSLKCQVFDMPAERSLGRVRIERIGDATSPTEWTERDGTVRSAEVSIPDRASAIRYLLDRLTDPQTGILDSLADVAAVGFKTVYANGITGCQYLDDRVVAAMADYNEVIAPLHNPVYIQAIESFKEVMPNTPMVGLFENSFFDKLPDYATIYPIPWDWTRKYGIRKHLFHGASHNYVARRVPELVRMKPEEINIITCHLGGSSTIVAFQGGVCIDGLGGFSLQYSVPASVRSSDMDAFIIPFLVTRGEGTVEQVVDRMMTEGGLAGISGIGFDFRDLLDAASKGHKRAKLAVDTYVYQCRRAIGGFMAILGRVDVITFAGGTGESSAVIRKMILRDLENYGIVLDDARNDACFRKEARISADDSKVDVWVVPTNEELVVAQETYKLLTGQGAAPNWLENAPPWADYD